MISGSNELLQQQLEYTLLKPDYHSLWISKMQPGRVDILEERYAIKFYFKLGRKAESLWGMMRGVTGVRKSIHQSWLAKGLRLGLGLLCWVLREFRKRSPRRGDHYSNRVSGISSWTMHQSTTPSVVTDYLTKMGINTVLLPPYSPDLAPCDFWLFPKLRRLSLWDNWRDERGCDEGHWHSQTRGLPLDLPKFVGTVQQVHQSRRIIRRRELELHVYTINKSTHTKKSGNLLNNPRMYICMYGWMSVYQYIYSVKLLTNTISRCGVPLV